MTTQPPADNEAGYLVDKWLGSGTVPLLNQADTDRLREAINTALSAQAARVQTLETLLKHSETTTSWHVEQNAKQAARLAAAEEALELARRALVTGLASYEQPLLLGRFGTEATSAIAAIRTTEAARVGETPEG